MSKIQLCKTRYTISINNGLSTCDPVKAYNQVDWDVIRNHMDDEITEDLLWTCRNEIQDNLDLLYAYLLLGEPIVIG